MFRNGSLLDMDQPFYFLVREGEMAYPSKAVTLCSYAGRMKTNSTFWKRG